MATLSSGCSVDFVASADVVSLRTESISAISVSGSYDQLEEDDRPRNGRIRLTGSTPEALVVNTPQKFYRIFNSSRTASFDVKLNTTKIATLTPGSSTDILSAGAETIFAVGTGAAEGSYSEPTVDDDDLADQAGLARRAGKIQSNTRLVSRAQGRPIYRISTPGILLST